MPENIHVVGPFEKSFYIVYKCLDLKTWKKLLYRFIDSNHEDEFTRSELTRIESEMFHHIKPMIEKELSEEWTGTKHQNQIGDLKVAEAMRSSFRSYERQGANDGHFFEF